MIKTLSPYYVYPSLDNGSYSYSEYTLNIYIWNGLQSAKPTTPEYTITRKNPEGLVGTDKVNISNIVNDYIEFLPQSNSGISLINGVNQVWVSVDQTAESTINLIETIAISGYGYGLEGENTDVPTNKILLTGTEFKVNSNTGFILPLIGNDTNVTVISYPSNDINTTINVPSSLNSNSIISYLWVDCSEVSTDAYIQVVYNGVTINLFVQSEYRYTPIDIHFKNKEGVQQVLTFFKERKDSASIESETYNSNKGQPINGYHQFKTYNVNSKSKFTVNSGFVDEEMNETFKQLLLSDMIWQYLNGSFIPLNISSKSFEYKSQVNDKLINYSIEFEYSFNDINDI